MKPLKHTDFLPLQYAMLAGYLPFDDDPENPEGDNINLLYKYIVSTPLTFPEYVTPHARDLLRRILVPSPRQRADLFEVARHSWLAPFANVVGLITSSTTSERDISNTTVNDGIYLSTIFCRSFIDMSVDLSSDIPLLTRSASVREPGTTTSAHPHATTIGGGRHSGHHEHVPQPTQQKVPGDNKRRTVQVEYVAPSSQTRRGDTHTTDHSGVKQTHPKDRQGTKDLIAPKPDSHLARAATTAGVGSRTTASYTDRPPTAGESSSRLPVPQSKARPASYQLSLVQSAQAAPTTSAKEVQIPSRRPSTRERSAPANSGVKPLPQSQVQSSFDRPMTSGSTTAGASSRLPSQTKSSSRKSAPAPSVTTTSAQGKLQQPQSSKPYVISNPIPIPDNTEQISSIGLPSTQPMPGPLHTKGRPSTQEALAQKDRGHKRANTVTGTSGGVLGRLLPSSLGGSQAHTATDRSPRASIDQGNRSPLSGKLPPPAKSRRFSLLPPFFPLRAMSGDKNKHERRPSRSASGNSVQQRRWDNQQHQQQVVGGGSSYPQLAVPSSRPTHDGSLSGSEASLAVAPAPGATTQQNLPPSASSLPSPELSQSQSSATAAVLVRVSEEAKKRPGLLQKNRKFTEAYEVDGTGAASSGSSGPARRVMDFFRRRRVNGNK